MLNRRFRKVVLPTAAALTLSPIVEARLTEQHAEQIQAAVPDKARVTPKIWRFRLNATDSISRSSR